MNGTRDRVLPRVEKTLDRSPSSSESIYVIAVLLLPLVVLWRQDNSLFTPPNRVDSWMYFGFFRSLHDFKDILFPNLYYGSRLSWILPGYLIHSIFPPVTGARILHLTVQSIANVSMFAIARLTVGARVAFLTTLLFAVSPQLANATGADYVDGPSIAFLLLSMACLTYAAMRPSGKLWLVIGGVSWAAMVYANLFWIVIGLLAPVHYLALLYWRSDSIFRGFLRLLWWFGLGCLGLTLLLCGINYRLDGSFWFYAPSLSFAHHVLEKNPYFQTIWPVGSLAPWLWFSAIGLTAACVAVFFWFWRGRPREEFPVALFSAEMVVAAAFLGGMQQASQPVLGLDFYASELLPFQFLVIGAYFWAAATFISRRSYLMLCAAAVVAFAFVWSDYNGRLLPVWPHASAAMAAVGALLLVGAAALRYRYAGMWLALAGFAVLLPEARFLSGTPTVRALPAPPADGPHAYRIDYERIAGLRQRLEAARKGRMVRFWYDNREMNPDFMAINSTYLQQYSWFATDFPSFPCKPEALENVMLIVLSQQQQAFTTAAAALSGCLAAAGLIAEPEGVETISARGFQYTVSLLGIHRDPAAWKPLQLNIDPSGQARLVDSPGRATAIPGRLWKTVSSMTRCVERARGYDLNAPKWRYGFIVLSPTVVAPYSGRYRFGLRYKPGLGAFAFGIPRPDLSDWRVIDPVERGSRQRMVSIDLDKGDSFQLAISSYNDAEQPTSLSVTGITIMHLDRSPSR